MTTTLSRVILRKAITVDTTEFERFDDLYGDYDTPLFGMRLIEFVNDKGDMRFKLAMSGHADSIRVMGLLEEAKAELQHRIQAKRAQG